MDEDAFTLTLSPPEMAFTVGALGVSPRLLDDPFSGWPADRSETALRQAQESLVARGCIQVQPEGHLALDIAVAALVGALAFAEAALMVTRIADGEEHPATRGVYFAAGLIVEQERQPDGNHALTAVRNHEVVAQRLIDYLGIAEQQAPSVQPCMLPLPAIAEAQRIAAVEGEQVCASFLIDEEVPDDVASSLAQAMAYPVCQSSLLALSWEGQEPQRLYGFTLLEDGQGLWLLQPLAGTDEERLEVTPCDISRAKHQVEKMVRLAVSKMQEVDSQEQARQQ